MERSYIHNAHMLPEITVGSKVALQNQAQSAKPSACHKNTIQSNTYHMHAY